MAQLRQLWEILNRLMLYDVTSEILNIPYATTNQYRMFFVDLSVNYQPISN